MDAIQQLKLQLEHFLKICTDEAVVELGKVAFGYHGIVRKAKHLIRKRRVIHREIGGEG